MKNIFIFLLRLLTSAVLPEFQFSDGDKLALLAFKRLDLPLGVDPGHADLKHPQWGLVSAGKLQILSNCEDCFCFCMNKSLNQGPRGIVVSGRASAVCLFPQLQWLRPDTEARCNKTTRYTLHVTHHIITTRHTFTYHNALPRLPPGLPVCSYVPPSGGERMCSPTERKKFDCRRVSEPRSRTSQRCCITRRGHLMWRDFSHKIIIFHWRFFIKNAMMGTR